MTLRDRLAAFWYHPTIDAMQAQMLRYVWCRRPSLRLLKSMDDAMREADRIARLFRGGPKRIYHINDYMNGVMK